MEGTKLNRLIIIGASGHGRVVADIAKLCGYTEIVFLDNNPDLKECAGCLVAGSASMVKELEGDVFVAVGNMVFRKKLMEQSAERKFPVLIHPKAVVAEGTKIGIGSVVMAGTVINPGVVIGKGCIVNTSSSVDHDCQIGDYCHISVGAHLCGTIKVANGVWIGAGATINNNLNICCNSIIGSGAVLVNDIEEPGIYIGVPARLKK